MNFILRKIIFNLILIGICQASFASLPEFPAQPLIHKNLSTPNSVGKLSNEKVITKSRKSLYLLSPLSFCGIPDFYLGNYTEGGIKLGITFIWTFFKTYDFLLETNFLKPASGIIFQEVPNTNRGPGNGHVSSTVATASPLYKKMCNFYNICLKSFPPFFVISSFMHTLGKAKAESLKNSKGQLIVLK